MSRGPCVHPTIRSGSIILISHARVPLDAVESEPLETAFGKFLRGLAHMSVELIYSGYRELCELGPAVVPTLVYRIIKTNWRTVTRLEATHMQTGLVSLLHDIDEVRPREIIGRLLGRDRHPALRGVLQSICRYDDRNIRTHDIFGLRVMVAREIDESESVTFHLKQWLLKMPFDRTLLTVGCQYVFDMVTSKPCENGRIG